MESEETGGQGSPDRTPAPFQVKDCALLALATGRKALLLREFREELTRAPLASIYHHFWGGLLQARFGEREFNNDFAAWVRHGIHDAVLAERVAALDPTDYAKLETLRRDLIELIDNRIDEVDHLAWTRATQQFEFIRSQIVVFDTGQHLFFPSELAQAVPSLPASSIFYHFIDARRRTSDGRDDFSDWLAAFGGDFTPLIDGLAGIDPYFASLPELRDTLATLFISFFQEAHP